MDYSKETDGGDRSSACDQECECGLAALNELEGDVQELARISESLRQNLLKIEIDDYSTEKERMLMNACLDQFSAHAHVMRFYKEMIGIHRVKFDNQKCDYCRRR